MELRNQSIKDDFRDRVIIARAYANMLRVAVQPQRSLPLFMDAVLEAVRFEPRAYLMAKIVRYAIMENRPVDVLYAAVDNFLFATTHYVTQPRPKVTFLTWVRLKEYV